jgi:nitrate/nitrite transporter NarK
VVGFSGAIGAYGGFFIPKSYGSSITLTGSPDMALYGFIVFYITCLAVTWWWYYRRGAETLLTTWNAPQPDEHTATMQMSAKEIPR